MKKPARKIAKIKPASRPRKAAGLSKVKVLFTESQVRSRVRALAAQLNRQLGSHPVLIVSVLENAFVFTADLIRNLKLPVYCSFVRADIRDSSVGGVETREITYTPSVDAAGKDVILVDGILQSGMTFDHLYRYLSGQGPSSLRTMVLVEKTDERKVDMPLDFVGFQATGNFVVGYGLGQNGKYKNLPYIAQLG